MQTCELYGQTYWTRISVFFIGFSLLHLPVILCNECPVERCNAIERKTREIVTFTQNGKPVPPVSKALILTSQNASCLLDTNSITQKFSELTGNDFIGTIALFCPKPIELHLTSYNGSVLENIIGYVQIVNCIISKQSVNEISRSMDTRVVILFKVDLTNNTNNCTNTTAITSDCEGLSNTVAFTIQPMSNKPSVQDLFGCIDVFPSMTEITFANMSWNVVPDILKVKFPNLQTLDIPHNNLSVPPDFPWTDKEVLLPKNLSRSENFQSHYTNVFHVNIQPNIYRRFLNLDYNKISNLTNYEFRGFLHMLTIESNSMEDVGSSTFEHIQGLQHLSLSKNNLKTLPVGTFKNLRSLQHLDISRNKLINLPPGIFDNLSSLRYMNLANNSLTSITNRLFYYLNSLEELRLEINMLSSIPTESFPIASVRLERVYLNNNPMKTFPDSLFYLRSLKTADLRNTSLSWNLSKLIHETDKHAFANSVVESASASTYDFTKDPERLRVINLSGSKINSFDLNSTLDDEEKVILLLILKNFKFILDNNPILCNCKINNFKSLVSIFLSNNTLSGKEYFFKDWQCKSPPELSSLALFSIDSKDTYCKIQIKHCPLQCTCSKRYKQNVTIINCRKTGLLKLPKYLPSGTLDLWFEHNNITELSDRPYLNRIRQLYLSRNYLGKLHKHILSKMKNIKELFLDSNLLEKIPRKIKELALSTVKLKDNPFECDCHIKWMKIWLLRNQNIISDSSEISCSTGVDEGKKIITTPDHDFICKEQFNRYRHVIIPTVSSSITLAVLIIIVGLLIVYRLEVKVLLYVYFGIHPFDKDETDSSEEYDVAIVHAPSITTWVMDHVVTTLEREGHSYIVCEMMRDFVAGFSYQENITNVVRRSRRMLLIISPSLSIENDLFRISWKEAEQKVKEIRTNYAIFIGYNLPQKSLKNKDLRIITKRNRFITSTDRLFKEKLLYLMPTSKSQNVKNSVQSYSHEYNSSSISLDTISVHTLHPSIPIFVTYAEQDVYYVISSLVPRLEKMGFELCLPDRDFVLGASKEENILQAVASCDHTLFILSGNNLEDEWLLFTFRCASEKSLREKSNHLILVLLDNVNVDNMDDEITYYVRTHVTLKISNPWFWKRVRHALSTKKLEKPKLKCMDFEISHLKSEEMHRTEIDVKGPKENHNCSFSEFADSEHILIHSSSNEVADSGNLNALNLCDSYSNENEKEIEYGGKRSIEVVLCDKDQSINDLNNKDVSSTNLHTINYDHNICNTCVVVNGRTFKSDNDSHLLSACFTENDLNKKEDIMDNKDSEPNRLQSGDRGDGNNLNIKNLSYDREQNHNKECENCNTCVVNRRFDATDSQNVRQENVCHTCVMAENSNCNNQSYMGGAYGEMNLNVFTNIKNDAKELYGAAVEHSETCQSDDVTDMQFNESEIRVNNNAEPVNNVSNSANIQLNILVDKDVTSFRL